MATGQIIKTWRKGGVISAAVRVEEQDGAIEYVVSLPEE